MLSPRPQPSQRRGNWKFQLLVPITCVAFGGGLLIGLNMSSWKFVEQNNEVSVTVGAPRKVLSGAAPKRMGLPVIPTGTPTELYKKHLYLEVDHQLALDSHANVFNYHGDISITEQMLVAGRAKQLQSAWLARVSDFRNFLTENHLNTIDTTLGAKSVFSSNLDTRAVWSDSLGSEDPSHCYCPCDMKTRPVVDMALVIPLDGARFNSSWPLLESIRQLTVNPKEIVLVVGNAAAVKEQMFGFLNVIQQIYVPDLPTLTSLKVYVSDQKFRPGENRWFGFNQTTAPIVSLFDGDDYMHPQFFHIFWDIFHRRPELDFALMNYEDGSVKGVCRGDMFYPRIREFLTKRQFNAEQVRVGGNWPDSWYETLWGMIPTFNKTWYLGNTDAEPNWGDGSGQEWWDMGCHNGWLTFRRYVMEMIPPPVKKFGGEDAIFNFRVARARFNYRCVELVLGSYLKAFCTTRDNGHMLLSSEDILGKVVENGQSTYKLRRHFEDANDQNRQGVPSQHDMHNFFEPK